MLNTVQKLFGERLAKLREERGLSVPQFAELLGHQRAGINQIERGEAAPGFKTLVQMAEILRVEPVDLFLFPTVHVRYELMELTRQVPFMAVVEMRDRVKEVRDRVAGPPVEAAEASRRAGRRGREVK